MEYGLSLNLIVLNEWSGTIDVIDAFLAAIINKYEDARDALEHNVDGYVWINHDYLLKQFPLLDFGKRQLERRLKHLIEVGLIEREISQVTMNGRKTYYKMTYSYRCLEEHYKFAFGTLKLMKHCSEAERQEIFDDHKPEILVPKEEYELRERIPAGHKGAGRFRNSGSTAT